MCITSIIWLPVLLIGYLLIEMKLLYFKSFYNKWKIAWTLTTSTITTTTITKTKDMKCINNIDNTLSPFISISLWKYMVLCDGIIQSLPMCILKIIHVIMFGLLTTTQKVLLWISIIISFVCLVHSIVMWYNVIYYRLHRKSAERLQEKADSIITFMHDNRYGSNLTQDEVHDSMESLHYKISHTKLMNAEQQLFVALQNYTQENLDIPMRLAALNLTNPQTLRHTSVSAMSEVISHVKHRPITKNVRNRGIKKGEKDPEDTHVAIVEKSEHLKEQMRSIANCVTIQKPFIYRVLRFYKKKFAYAVEEIRKQYRVEEMTSIFEKLMWYLGISVLIMFAKIFILFIIVVINRLIESTLKMLTYSRICRWLFEKLCCCFHTTDMQPIHIDLTGDDHHNQPQQPRSGAVIGVVAGGGSVFGGSAGNNSGHDSDSDGGSFKSAKSGNSGSSKSSASGYEMTRMDEVIVG